MKITDLRVALLCIPLRCPFKTALRTVTKIENVIVELQTDTGCVGYGEAPPTGVITGDTRGAILGACREHLRPLLVGRNLEDFEELQFAVQHALQKNGSAKAAVDMALWDLYGQQCKLSVFDLLGGGRTQLTTDLTISVNLPEEMANDAVAAVQRGYDCLKIKVGVDPELDIERLLAVRRAVGGGVRLRVDANQAWNAKQAVKILTNMQERGIDLELAEQPVSAQDLEGLQYVTRYAPVPIMADESVFSPMEAVRLMQLHAADMINIKLMKCGGITNALKILAAAEIYGVECMMGCMLESKVANNAAVSVACARRMVTRVDLDGPGLCDSDPIEGGADFNEKTITVCRKPGLGITKIHTLQYLREETSGI